jgi:deferrochelatase/peroxidase EfeB
VGLIMPQFGIFAQGTHAHQFLEFDLRPGVSPQAALSSFRRLRTPDVSAGGVNLVVAFGSVAWRAVAPTHAPAALSDFHEIDGAGHRRAPATQHDAWMWISGSAPDVTFDHARAAARIVADVADLAAEQAGFTYHEGRTRPVSWTAPQTRPYAERPKWPWFRRENRARAAATSSPCAGCMTLTRSDSFLWLSRNA